MAERFQDADLEAKFRKLEKRDLSRINDLILEFNTSLKLEDLESNPFNRYIAYTIDGVIIGIIIYSIKYEYAELEYIVIDKNYRRKNIASKLMNYMIEDLIKNNVISVSLEVNVENIPAINLYKKFAFEKATIRKNYYGNKDAVLMIRKLIS